VSKTAAPVRVGDYLRFRGEVLHLQEVSAVDVVVRDVGQNLIKRIATTVLLAEAWPCTSGGEVVTVEQDLRWDIAPESVRDEVLTRVRDLMWVVTGRRGETFEDIADAPAQKGITERVAKLAAERGVSTRSIWRDRDRWADGGLNALVRAWTPVIRRSEIDPRWEAKVREVVKRYERKSRRSRKLVLETVSRELDGEHGKGIVRIPGDSTAYDYLARTYAGTNAFSGSTKGQRSIAERPDITPRQLTPTRPGEYIIMDTHDIDAFALDAASKQWVQCQLTVAQDLYTRAIVGMRVTAVSTKAVDVASVLFEVCHPGAIRGHAVDPRGRWAYHGVPENIVFTEEADHWGMPLVAAENLVVDNGKAFVSRHVLNVCHTMGINVFPAQPYKPTDKPTVERFFRTLREELIMRLPGYKGPDVYSRGESPESEAFYFTHELETAIRLWITRRYHKHPHGGLVDPRWPETNRSPNQMYELAVAIHGLPRIAPHPFAFVEFLPVKWRKFMHYGFQIDKRRYRSEILRTFGGRESPYGGPNAGSWPLRYNPDDITRIYIQHPETLVWHELEWEYSHKFDLPLSSATYRVLRDRWERSGEPIERTYDILTDFLASTELTRKDRNALLRSAHLAEASRVDAESKDEGSGTGQSGDERELDRAWDEELADDDADAAAGDGSHGTTEVPPFVTELGATGTEGAGTAVAAALNVSAGPDRDGTGRGDISSPPQDDPLRQSSYIDAPTDEDAGDDYTPQPLAVY